MIYFTIFHILNNIFSKFTCLESGSFDMLNSAYRNVLYMGGSKCSLLGLALVISTTHPA